MMKKVLPLLFALSLLLIGLFALCHPQRRPAADLPASLSADSVYLVCRLGDGFFSSRFKEYASRSREFSHIGILARSDSGWVVYHTEASELTGMGGVKREPLGIFLEGLTDYAFYKLELDGAAKHRILVQAEKFYRAHIPFDLKFDYTDSSKLYCTELVAKVLNYATGGRHIRPTLVLDGKAIVSIDDITDRPFVKLFQKYPLPSKN